MIAVARIHACPNYCILYRGDTFKDLNKCPVCSASRYKNNAGYCGDDNQGPIDVNKGKGNVAKNSVASIVSDDATLLLLVFLKSIPGLR